MAKKEQNKVEKKEQQVKKYKVKVDMLYNGTLYPAGTEVELDEKEAKRLYALLEPSFEDKIVKK